MKNKVEETTLKNKELYKLTLFVLKVLPIVMAVSYFLNVYCSFVGVGFQLLTHYLGIVIAPLVFMYLSSHVFRFCNYHRMFIYYIASEEILALTDYYFHLPVSDFNIHLIHFANTALFFTTAIVLYLFKKGILKTPKWCSKCKINI